MADVTISEAARLAGKGRSTIQRHIKDGKLSVSRDASGNPLIDTSELIRVYGSIQGVDAQQAAPVTQGDAPTVELLREQLRQAHEREEWLKRQLEEEKERSRELERRVLPPGEDGQAKKGFWSRVFGK